MNWGLLVGLIAIGLGLFFGLRSFGGGFKEEFRNIATHLANISEKVAVLTTKFDSAWAIMYAQMYTGGTINRELLNLGKIQISASPEERITNYDITVEKVVLQGGLIEKASKESGFYNKEVELFGEPSKHMIISPRRMRLTVPSVDPKVCTEFVTSYLGWLDSKYVEWLRKNVDFENDILS